MNIGWQRILSMVFLITALGMFIAMHLLPSSLYPGRGWKIWIGIGQTLQSRRVHGKHDMVIIFSFLTFSLIILASPFLGNVWVKSLLAWSMVVIFSGVAAAGFWGTIFQVASIAYLKSGGWFLLISTLLNFLGLLLLARPQWLKKSGPPFLDPGRDRGD